LFAPDPIPANSAEIFEPARIATRAICKRNFCGLLDDNETWRMSAAVLANKTITLKNIKAQFL